MKNNKILISSIFILAIIFSFISNVSAVSKPLSFLDITNIEQPVAPGTDYSGECTPWEIKDEYCIGNTRRYTQCQQTASGGVWQPHNEVCTEYGNNVVCLEGRCIKSSDIFLSVAVGFLAIVGGVFLTILIIRKLRGKKRR